MRKMLVACGLFCVLPLQVSAADGTLAWAKRAGGTWRNRARDVAALSAGSSFVTGEFWGVATFGPGEAKQTTLVSAGESDIFIARYNADGTLAWTKRAGGTHVDVSFAVAALADGSSFVTGEFCGVATFGPGDAHETTLSSAGYTDIFLARYNADGTLAWATRAGGVVFDFAYEVAVLADGSSFVTGDSQDDVTFGLGEANETTLFSTGGNNIFLARFSPDGTLAWAKGVGHGNDDCISALSLSVDGSSLVTGDFWDAATFGSGEANETTLSSAGNNDIFIARYNADGTLAWAKRAGGAHYDLAYGVAALADSSSFVAGEFRGTSTFGPGEANETTLVSAGETDIFLARYNVDGTLAWAKRAGGAHYDLAYGVAALADGSCRVAGEFRGTSTFGPGEANETTLVSAGETDIFIAYYRADGTLVMVVRAGGAGDEVAYGIAALADGSSFVTGEFWGVATFGPGEAKQTTLVSAGESDIFIARFDLCEAPATPTPIPAPGGAWPMFRRDARHSGQSPYRGARAPGLKWSYDLASGSITMSSPVIGEDGGILIGADHPAERMYRIDPDGSFAWSYETGCYLRNSAAVGEGGRVLFGGGWEDRHLYCLDSTGALAWSYAAGLGGSFFNASPLLGAGGRCYIGSGDERLYAVDSAGSLVWSYRTGGDLYSSPALDEAESVYCGCTDNRLYVLASDGAFRWSYLTGGFLYSSVALGPDGASYIGSEDNRLYRLDSVGSLSWSYETGSYIRSSPAVAGSGRVYVGSYDCHLYCVSSSGSLVWRSDVGGAVYYSSPALDADETSYVGTRNHRLHCINPDGSSAWVFAAEGEIEGSPVIGADGTIYCIASNDRLYALNGDAPSPAETPAPPATSTPEIIVTPSHTPAPPTSTPTATPEQTATPAATATPAGTATPGVELKVNYQPSDAEPPWGFMEDWGEGFGARYAKEASYGW